MPGDLQTVRRSYEAFARGDLTGALAAMDPEIEWHQAQGLPHGGVYRGLETVRATIFDPIEDAWWDSFRADPDEFHEAGEHLVVLGRYTARAKHTGAPLDVPFVHVWTMRGGKAVRFRQFTDTAGWVQAQGGAAANNK